MGPNNIIVAIDTREQAPFAFGPTITTIHKALPAGDYSLAGLETTVAVERKHLDDFVGTVIADWERFKRELTKLRNYRYAAVLIEGSLAAVRAGRYKSRAAPESVLGRALAIQVNWGVPVIWAGDRPHAKDWCEHFLEYCYADYLRSKETSGQ